MKKTLIAALMVSFALPNLVMAVTSSELEQIPSPDYLPFYKVLEKRGNSLWGHRLISKEEMKAKLAEKKEVKKEAIAEKKEVKKEAKEAKKLEKIPAPAHVKFFEGIRQVGNALWGFVKNNWAYGLGRLTKADAPCVAAAIGVRDASVRTAMVAHDSVMLAAYDARTACHQTAMTKDTAKEMAAELVKCNTSFQAARKEAWKNFLVARDAAWKLFREELKKCAAASNPSLEEANDDTQDVIEAIDDEDLDDIGDEAAGEEGDEGEQEEGTGEEEAGE